MDLNKYCYYDVETANDISIIGFKNFASMGFACGCIGYENNNKYIREESTDIKDYFVKLASLIKMGYTLFGFNNIGFDNNVLAHQLGVISAEDYLELPIGGTKGDTLWKDVDSGWLKWCVDNRAGQYAVSKAVLDYRNNVPIGDKKTIKSIKEFLDKNSVDLMLLIDEATGENYSTNLNSVTRLTINEGKTREGSEVAKLYKEGKINEIVEYCHNDVKILHDLTKFIEKYNYVIIPLYKKYGKLLNNICLKVELNLK
jgi:hypothetical protein